MASSFSKIKITFSFSKTETRPASRRDPFPNPGAVSELPHAEPPSSICEIRPSFSDRRPSSNANPSCARSALHHRTRERELPLPIRPTRARLSDELDRTDARLRNLTRSSARQAMDGELQARAQTMNGRDSDQRQTLQAVRVQVQQARFFFLAVAILGQRQLVAAKTIIFFSSCNGLGK